MWVGVCHWQTPTSLIHKRLRKRLAKELRESYEEVTFATARLQHILNTEYKGRVWFPIDEDGDDPDEPREAVGLVKLWV